MVAQNLFFYLFAAVIVFSAFRIPNNKGAFIHQQPRLPYCLKLKM